MSRRVVVIVLLLGLVLLGIFYLRPSPTLSVPHTPALAVSVKPLPDQPAEPPLPDASDESDESDGEVYCELPRAVYADTVIITTKPDGRVFEAPVQDRRRFRLPEAAPGARFRFETDDQQVRGHVEVSGDGGCRLFQIWEEGVPELETRCSLGLQGLDERISSSDLTLSEPRGRQNRELLHRTLGVNFREEVAEAYIEDGALVIQGSESGDASFSVSYTTPGGVPVYSALLKARWDPEGCAQPLSSIGYVWVSIEASLGELIHIRGCGVSERVEASRVGLLIPADQPCTLRASRDLGMSLVTSEHAGLTVAEGESAEVVFSFPEEQYGDAGLVLERSEIRLVASGSPGALAGLRTEDIVVAIGGEAVVDDEEAIREQARALPGETVTWTIERDGERFDVPLTYREPNRY